MALQKREMEMSSLSGSGDFSLKLGLREIKGRALVMADRAGSFRVDILTPFFQPIYTIIYHKGLLSVLSLEEGRLYMRKMGFNDTFYISNIPTRPLYIASLIFGSPLLSGVSLKKEEINRDIYTFKVLSKDGFTYQLHVDPEGPLLMSFDAHDTKGSLIYTQRNQFVLKGRYLLPSVIEGRYKGIELHFTYDRLNVLDKIKDEDFRLRIPKGVEEVYVNEFAPSGLKGLKQ